MSALAKLLSVFGYSISGSDQKRSAYTDGLPFYGVKVFVGERCPPPLLQADCVVYTDAVPDLDEELAMARRLNKPIYRRAELLKIVCEAFQTVVAVAGSHGKTTCASMCAHVLKSVGAPFAAHIGGEDIALGNFWFSGEEYFVTEACEYKKNLLNLRSDVGILLNVDQDHMECYRGEADLVSTFATYCKNSAVAFVCADDVHAKAFGEYPSFGIDNPVADYRAVKLRAVGERYTFTVEEYGKAVCRVTLNAVGRCNVYNALAAFAAMRCLGFSVEEVGRGVQAFTAVKRRFEKIGEYRGCAFLCDYAHHPKEILSTVATAQGICRGALYVVFQPHTYSRTKLLWQDFLSVLGGIQNLAIYPTFAAREAFDEVGSGKRLAESVGCLYIESAPVLKTWLKQTVKEGDLVLFLGAGDIYHAAKYVLSDLLGLQTP